MFQHYFVLILYYYHTFSKVTLSYTVLTIKEITFVCVVECLMNASVIFCYRLIGAVCQRNYTAGKQLCIKDPL